MIRTLLPSGARAVRLLSTEPVAYSSNVVEERPMKRIGRALETYIKLSKEHVSMMARERADFELGKRHLANMMNLDPQTLTQEDVDSKYIAWFRLLYWSMQQLENIAVPSSRAETYCIRCTEGDPFTGLYKPLRNCAKQGFYEAAPPIYVFVPQVGDLIHLACTLRKGPNVAETEAIKYLFPSGLFDPNARPVMRPPDEILPKFHRFEFDEEGRPKDSRFFTLFPTFYKLLSDIAIKTRSITSFYNDHLSLGRKGTELDQIKLGGTQWIGRDKLEKKLNEKISEEMYAHLLMAFDYLVSLPSSAVEEKFIMQYREPLAASTKSKLFGPRIPEVTICPETQRRTTSVTTHCKDTKVNVQVMDAGSGNFDIDGHALNDFRHLIAREILLAPMIVAGLLGRVDVKASSKGSGGVTALPRAVRHGTALGIAALYPETTESLRIAGLLTLDPRKKERNKVNQPGARAKWIWHSLYASLLQPVSPEMSPPADEYTYSPFRVGRNLCRRGDSIAPRDMPQHYMRRIESPRLRLHPSAEVSSDSEWTLNDSRLLPRFIAAPLQSPLEDAVLNEGKKTSCQHLLKAMEDRASRRRKRALQS